jgi:hypothetical protein
MSFKSILLLLLVAVISGCSDGEVNEPIATKNQETPVLSYADLAATSDAFTSMTEESQPTETTEAISAEGQAQTSSTSTSKPPTEGSVSNANTPTLTTADAPNTPTPLPTTPVLTAPPTVTPFPFDPLMILGLPVELYTVLPDEVAVKSQEIFNRGRALGRDSQAFSKLGDSLIANPHFLTGFDTGTANLGEYSYLQPVVDHFAGSYERYGVAIHAGLHSWGIFDPMWANKDWCEPNESMVACEIRLNNPSVLLILLGSNDSGAPDSFAYNLRKVVEFSIENGVIPVLATKADRFEGPENTNNILVRTIAAEYAIPLWDFDMLADAIPDRGLTEDLVHLTPFDEYDYTMPEAMQKGHGVHNLTALMVLESIRTQVMQFP